MVHWKILIKTLSAELTALRRVQAISMPHFDDFVYNLSNRFGENVKIRKLNSFLSNYANHNASLELCYHNVNTNKLLYLIEYFIE